MSRTERISSVILIMFGLFVAYYSRQYLKLGIMISPGAGFIPFYIGVALMVLGAIWFFSALLKGKGPAQTEEENGIGDAEAEKPDRGLILYRFLPGVILVILYAWLFERAGYILSTVLFMIGWQKVVEREGWLKTMVIAVVCAGTMYTLFAYLLKLALPTGTWFS
jgi:putative tricarboxylic transport membrane protein